MTALQTELFSELAEPFTGEALFDCLSDVVFFIKNRRCEYVVMNQTLVERCGRRSKAELIGRRADELFPSPLGEGYRAQDESVLGRGEAILKQLELHFYAQGGRGWGRTHRGPLGGGAGGVIGLMGISRDLRAARERDEDFTSVAKMVRHIQEHFGEPLRVKQLATGAGLSGYQFEQRIRRIFSLTAGQLIQKTRMEAAVQRLRETKDAIAEIALACGYSDQSAFTRQFRQTTGLTPSEYRAAYGTKGHASAERGIRSEE
jgi:AraC-like DNA-binding protein